MTIHFKQYNITAGELQFLPGDILHLHNSPHQTLSLQKTGLLTRSINILIYNILSFFTLTISFGTISKNLKKIPDNTIFLSNSHMLFKKDMLYYGLKRDTSYNMDYRKLQKI